MSDTTRSVENMTLDELRQEIADVDQKILTLIQSRIRVARAIGLKKIAAGLPVRDRNVESQVIKRNTQNPIAEGLDEVFVENLTRLLIDYSVDVQIELHRINLQKSSGQHRRIGIIGINGGMGQRFAKAFTSLGHDVVGYDKGESQATTPTLKELCNQCEFIMIATPMETTASIIESICKLGTKAVVFDISSIKSPAISAVENAKRSGIRYISTHPMFGPSAGSLVDRNFLICDSSTDELTKEITDLVAPLGLKITCINHQEHDLMMSRVLGLPHLMSFLFLSLCADEKSSFSATSALAGTTFNRQMDVARFVASQHAALYHDIQHLNRFSSDLFARAKTSLEELKTMLLNDDETLFAEFMEDMRKKIRD